MAIYPKLIVPLQIDLAIELDGTYSSARLTHAPETRRAATPPVRAIRRR